ncbi:hypothetical protein [Neoroseomonas soli]|uniref:YfhO family protein n=1 Tax=Neoroseomonas soli TaxID=1081025 RepID=A0A9X9WSL9_9PROT|nr:hypothetical protein [Neoroseomonas soli]MBR0670148.1 hypothetical protein [Neoroseomonas soli]
MTLSLWLIVLACVTWFVLDPVKDAVLVAWVSGGRALAWRDAAVAAAGALTAPRLALLCLAAAVTVALPVMERRRQAFSALLTEGGWPLLLAFAALVLWFGHSYLGHGLLLSGDTVAHVSMVTTRVAAIETGDDPYWTNFKRFGQPLEAFYSPTTFWPLVWLALGSGPMAALRIFLFIAHALSGLAAYGMCRQFGFGRRAAVIAGIVYAGSFAHLHALLYRGNIPLALSLAVLPLCFLLLHRVLAAPRVTAAPLVALAVACGVLLANYTPFGVIAGIDMGLFAIALMLAGQASWRRLPALAAAAIAAGGVAAFVLVPAWLAQSEVKSVPLAELVYLEWPGLAYFDHLLVWRGWRTNMPGAAAYLGIVAVGLAVLTVLRAALGREPPGPQRTLLRILAGLLVLSLFLRGMHVRDIGFTLLFMAVLAGAGLDHLLSRFGRRHGLTLTLAALLLLDLGSTAIQPIGRTDKGFLERAGAYLAASRPPSRYLEGRVEEGRFAYEPGTGMLTWYAAESVGGGHVEMATPAWIHGDLAGLLVEEDLRAHGALRAETQDLLCLLRVGRIIATEPSSMGLPTLVRDTEAEGPLGRVLVPRCAFSVVFARELAPAPMAPMDARVGYGDDTHSARMPAYRRFVPALLSGMALDRESGTAFRILVPGLQEPRRVGDAAASAGGVVVRRYDVSGARVRIDAEAAGAGFLRLSHAWHPRLIVSVNGSGVEALRDVTGMLVIPVGAGALHIEVTPGPDKARILGEAVSVATLAVLLMIFVGAGLRRRRP